MAVISTREQLVDYCLRRLGEPVIEVNVDEDQIEDKVDDALQVYREFHSDATRRNYYQHQLTATDVENRYISIPSRIIYVTKMFPVSASFVGSSNMFSFNYQFAMSDFHTLSQAGGLAYYDQTMSYMELIDMKINGLPMISFVRRMDRLYLWSDIEDEQLKVGDYICLECYEVVPTPEQIENTPRDRRRGNLPLDLDHRRVKVVDQLLWCNVPDTHDAARKAMPLVQPLHQLIADVPRAVPRTVPPKPDHQPVATDAQRPRPLEEG